MPNQLTTTDHQSTHLPSLPLRVDRALSGVLNRLEPRGRGELVPAAYAPSAEQRAWLGTRVAAIDAHLRPATSDEITMEVAMLLDSMAVEGGGETSRSVRIAAYETVLVGLPYVGIARACAGYRSGDLGDRKWVPKPPELCQAVKRAVLGLQDEQARISRILKAQVLPAPETSPERRAELAAQARAMVHVAAANAQLRDFERKREVEEPAVDIGPEFPDTEESQCATAQAALDQLAASPPPPLKLSPDAMATMRTAAAGDMDGRE